MREPIIIQGGMGAAVSNYRLANAVARLGQLGVVSGTALDTVLLRRLQDGDPEGDMRRALAHFPVAAIAQRVLDAYYRPGGRRPDEPYVVIPMPTQTPTVAYQELAIVANFAEVWLAKEGHPGRVGINFLEKIQVPMLPSLYGAMLAGVDYVLMGAGIPREIPGVLDRLARHEVVSLHLHVEGATSEDDFRISFDPHFVIPRALAALKRPKFLAIVASSTLAVNLARKSTGQIDGFVIEGPTAGGHNAPPRGPLQLNPGGEPVYGAKDVVDLEVFRALELPFWLAGSYGDPQRVKEALQQGAAGVQVGTAFALCKESGLEASIKARLLEHARQGEAVVFTDPVVSPAGFPFKVAQVPETLSAPEEYAARPRLCDLGYLRHIYKKADGSLGYRCPAEPIDSYVSKGGAREETEGRKCLCNALMADIGLAQRQRSGYVELPLVTTGDDLVRLARVLAKDRTSYTAEDVIRYLLTGLPNSPAESTTA